MVGYFGLWTRASSILIMITMFFAGLYHLVDGEPGELAFIYFTIYLVIFILGPGNIVLIINCIIRSGLASKNKIAELKTKNHSPLDHENISEFYSFNLLYAEFGQIHNGFGIDIGSSGSGIFYYKTSHT